MQSKPNPGQFPNWFWKNRKLGLSVLQTFAYTRPYDDVCVCVYLEILQVVRHFLIALRRLKAAHPPSTTCLAAVKVFLSSSQVWSVLVQSYHTLNWVVDIITTRTWKKVGKKTPFYEIYRMSGLFLYFQKRIRSNKKDIQVLTAVCFRFMLKRTQSRDFRLGY